MIKRMLQVLAGSTLAVAVALLLLRPGTAESRPGEEFLLPEPRPAPDFELTAHTGERVRLSDLAVDRTVVLFFGYTHCPDVCPVTLAALGRARALLGADGARFLPVLVTVDPARDTPDRMAAYLEHFPPGMLGLTGTQEALEAAAAAYGVYAEPDEVMAAGGSAAVDAAGSGGGDDPTMGGGSAGMAHAAHDDGSGEYTVTHTGRAFVVHDGAVRMTFPPYSTADAMAQGLGLLLER